tara:strand:- start:222 stop:908 length:687 start_codon:yes stop_codon:yes gene_type:complete
MRIIGLTGGIACGKSTVTAQLINNGVPVVDCDLIARQIVQPGKPALIQIQKKFGNKVILDNGQLNRPALGQIIFNDKSQNVELGKIMGPAIQAQIKWEILYAFLTGSQIVVVDAPTLYETKGLISMCGEIIVVATTEEIQLERLMARDKSTKKEANARISSQLPMETKINHPATTEVVMNNGSREQLSKTVNKMIDRVQNRAGVLHRVLTLPGILMLLGLGVYGVSRL